MNAETNDFRRKLVGKVKAMGQEVINRADDIVGECDRVCSLGVSFTFLPNSVPTLEVKREYLSKEYLNLGKEKHE